MERCFSDEKNGSFIERCSLPLVHGIPIVIINYSLVFIGTFGNFLIIFAVLKTPKLRHKISNYLLLSLAAADLFVTMFAQPLNATSVAFTTFRSCCIPEIDFAYDFAGNFSVFCSLFHLASISVDRALVVRKPHQHHDLMSKYGLKIMLVCCWGGATILASIRVQYASALFFSIGLGFFNFAIIIGSYGVILYEIKRERLGTHDVSGTGSVSSRDARMEKRVAGTIAIIIFFFSLCWFPLLGYYISVKRAVLREMGGITYMWIRTLVLSNSSMNFIVYSCRIKDFRHAYLRLINAILRRPREFFGIPGKFGTTTASAGASYASKDNDIMELTTPSGVYNKKEKPTQNTENTANGLTNNGREIDNGKEATCDVEDDRGGEEVQQESPAATVRFESDEEIEEVDLADPVASVTPKVTFNGELETIDFQSKSTTKSLNRSSKKFKLEQNTK